MALTYTTNEDAAPVIALVQRLFYPDLVRAKVTYEVLETAGGLKLHGYPAMATVRANTLKNRVAGLPDVRIELNSEKWANADKKRRQALIDHELHHVAVFFDDDDNTKCDDCGRPKVKILPHDFQIGGFVAVVERNREHALEAQHFAFWEQKLRQVEFDWAAADLMAQQPEEVEQEVAA